MKRLEKGSGDDLEFWEIHVQKKRRDVRIRSGLATTMGRTVVQEYASHELAIEAMARAIAEKLAEGGWAEPVQVRIAADCRKGVSLANPEIDALIAADPSVIDPYLVYSDWLLQRHDPRGELINVQAKLAQHPSSIDFQRMAEDLFRRFKKELLGDVIAELRASSPKSSLRWRYGFLRAARCLPLHGGDLVVRLGGLLTHRSAKFLEHLVISFGWTGSPQAVFSSVADLAPTTLTSLALGDRYSYRLDLEHLWPALAARPTIKTLTIASRMESVQVPNHPIQTIKTLRLIQLDRPALESLMTAEWPNVTDLYLHMPHPPRVRSYTPQGQPNPPPVSTPFVTLFPKAFPRVRRISFKIEPYYPDRFSEQVDEIESDLKSAAALLKTTLNLNPAPLPDLLDL